MTWAIIGASAVAAIGSMAKAGASGEFSGGKGGAQIQPGQMPQQPAAPPYEPTTKGAGAALPPPMPTQPIPAAGAPAAAPQMPQSMSPEELKKMYGIG